MTKIIDRVEIQRAFRKFVERPVPDFIDELYDDDHAQVIAEIFIMEKKAQGLIGSGSSTVDELMAFPLAKVFQVGKRWEANKGIPCKAGDILRLADNDVGSQINPDYRDYLDQNKRTHSGNREGGAKKGPPPTLISNISKWERRLFCPDPFQYDFMAWDGVTFYLDTANVVTKLKNPSLLYMLPEYGRVMTKQA